MDDAEYKLDVIDLDQLIDLGISISDSISNKRTQSNRDYYASEIFRKIIVQSVTLKNIIPTGIRPANNERELWDISSACTVTRSIIEAFDSLAYISIENISDIERDFRICLWDLHSEERRKKMFSLINSSPTYIAQITDNVGNLKEKVINHEFFENINENMKRNIRKGNSPSSIISKKERNERNNISPEYYNACIIFLSSYVHTFPLSIKQLMSFKAGDGASLTLLSAPVQYASVFLAKSIEGMNKIFSNKFFKLPDESLDLLEKMTYFPSKEALQQIRNK